MDKEESSFVVVTTNLKNYCDVQAVLKEYGKVEFDDYIWAPLWGKKLVALHGNCHMEIVKRILLDNDEFNLKYAIYEIPFIQCNKKGYIDTNLLQHLDVFIHQDIRNDNKYGERLSDEYNRKFLRGDCVDITVPNLFGYGKMFFPGFMWNPYNYVCEYDRNGLFPHSDRVLNELFEKNISVGEICDYLLKNPYEETEIMNNFREVMGKLREREKNWDIPMSDFLMNNYQREKLFHDQGHPTLFVMRYITEKIMDFLGIENKYTTYRGTMNSHEVFVYPCVMKTLGIEYENLYIRTGSDNKIASQLSFEEYIHEFCYISKLGQNSEA